MNRPAVILDCDPGHDDALAIIIAGCYCELLGITTVSGNVGLDQTTRNALITTQILGLDTPVHAGAARPLVAEPRHAEFIHGASGLDGPALPELNRAAASNDAVRFIIETVRARDDVWLVAVGPLTNVALALRTAPDIAGRLAGISIMGGGLDFGNVTAAAEFNILVDPEAAAAVFEAPVRKLLAPLDATHQFRIDEDAIARIRAVGGEVATFAADLLDFYGDSYARAFSGRKEGPLHDPCAVMSLTHPELFERRELHLQVELRGEHTRGMTLADRRGVRSGERPNCEVITSVEGERALEVLLEAVNFFGQPGSDTPKHAR
jgi:inosine-uridine nucleoside N-ribohydrolase